MRRDATQFAVIAEGNSGVVRKLLVIPRGMARAFPGHSRKLACVRGIAFCSGRCYTAVPRSYRGPELLILVLAAANFSPVITSGAAARVSHRSAMAGASPPQIRMQPYHAGVGGEVVTARCRRGCTQDGALIGDRPRGGPLRAECAQGGAGAYASFFAGGADVASDNERSAILFLGEYHPPHLAEALLPIPSR